MDDDERQEDGVGCDHSISINCHDSHWKYVLETFESSVRSKQDMDAMDVFDDDSSGHVAIYTVITVSCRWPGHSRFLALFLSAFGFCPSASLSSSSSVPLLFLSSILFLPALSSSRLTLLLPSSSLTLLLPSPLSPNHAYFCPHLIHLLGSAFPLDLFQNHYHH